MAMEFVTLSSRMSSRQGNFIYTFEDGRVIQRSHATVQDDVRAACTALISWGLNAGMRVGIRAPNSYLWIVYDLALLELGAVTVAFTDDFAGASPKDMRDKYSLSLLLVPASERGNHPAEDTYIVGLGADNAGARVFDLNPRYERDSSDNRWMVFSSGSAGGLKGLLLSRKGIEANIAGLTGAVGPRPDDCLLLFLPISNFQQRLMYYAALWYGFDLIVTEPSRLFRALKELRPTILIAPPSLYEAFETRFDNMLWWKRTAARLAAAAVGVLPVDAVREKLARLIFMPAHKMLGGRMRMMVTGMAPIKRSTLELFVLMQLPLYETYGLSEAGSVALNVPGARKIGSVGRLLPGIQIEIAEDGELIIHREHAQALGYFESAPGENEQTFIGGSRIASGDIGRFDADGYLYLLGRKKEIIVTAGGEKVHPEALEAEIDACSDVARSVVFASPGSPSISAVVLPKHPMNAEAKVRIKRFVDELNERRPSRSVSQVIFTDMVFSRENGFLRPNLKLDRKKIAAHFQPISEAAVA
ncbi:AMP-binding protein [Corallococcus llansteffanensis]|uniref:AMP-dependent synthetase/ligase domain-containing protein n=1 Tax=Corallococcus llansteffanensis TaxID=2316731 RepID=A0A3A8PY11_9BACT|nr:AMP-binding protein [Corallococcus llansteffanensis]RKH56234.1 hypothetical protein D7V93_20635 [Corallococcus llansteffanensis]